MNMHEIINGVIIILVTVNKLDKFKFKIIVLKSELISNIIKLSLLLPHKVHLYKKLQIVPVQLADRFR